MLPKSRFKKPIFGHSAGSTKLDRPYCKRFCKFHTPPPPTPENTLPGWKGSTEERGGGYNITATRGSKCTPPLHLENAFWPEREGGAGGVYHSSLKSETSRCTPFQLLDAGGGLWGMPITLLICSPHHISYPGSEPPIWGRQKGVIPICSDFPIFF